MSGVYAHPLICAAQGAHRESLDRLHAETLATLDALAKAVIPEGWTICVGSGTTFDYFHGSAEYARVITAPDGLNPGDRRTYPAAVDEFVDLVNDMCDAQGSRGATFTINGLVLPALDTPSI